MERTTKTSLATQMVRHATKKEIAEESHIAPGDLVPMGSTLLNLAMSGTIHGGAKKGTMVNVIGASHGGKTVLALTTFAEANRKKSFNNHAFIYDDVERANSFDMNYLFGALTAKRIQNARPDKEEQFSTTVQHFQANLTHWLKKGDPFIYVLDSYDALDAMEDQKKMEEMVDALEKDKKDNPGTYGMAKAKAGSSILRSVTSGLSSSKSVLFIISQTRDNVDPRSFVKETRSGGRALKFYAHHEMWLKPIGEIKKQDTPIGNSVEINITKNKITGTHRKVVIDIYYDYGIDDIGSCIDYLLKQGHWSGGGSAKINHKGDFDFENCTRPKFISLIEKNDLHRQLQRIVEKVWNEFENGLRLGRKNKYND